MRHYPYHEENITGDLSEIKSITLQKNIIVRADWFVFTASQPPFYGRFLNQPKNQQELEKSLGVDRIMNLKKGKVKRAGFEVSGISSHNRLIERHDSYDGFYWVSYDFNSSEDKRDLIENPLGPRGAFTGKRVFDHDGSEMIYSLPNGFQAYYLTDSSGTPVNVAPGDIVYDPSNEKGGRIIKGISCIACHDQGTKSASDEILTFVKRNPKRYTTEEHLSLIHI